MSFTYIASPYSDPDETVRLERYNKILKFTCTMLSGMEGAAYFSPIVHCHEMALKFGLPPTFEFWQTYNFNMLITADRLLVYCLDGWRVSLGVQGEIAFARGREMPIVLHDPNDGDQLIFAESAALDK